MNNPDPSSHHDTALHKWNIATQTLAIFAMTLFFFLRVYTRVFILKGFGSEDWTCLGAWILGTAYSVVALIMGRYGGGLHEKDVSDSNIIPFQKAVYVTMVLYGPTAYLTKVSLLWIMTRIFSPYRKVVILIYVFLALMLTYYIPAVIVKIRVCAPIAKFWNPSLNGSCLDSVAIYLADAVISVISDLIILMLPCPLTLSLQLPLRKRVRVMAILGAGGIACACSIIRLVLIVKNSSSKDRTYEFMRINMLGNAEIAIGVICACLPALTALISRVLHEYSSKRGTSDSRHELSRTPRATNGPHSATATTISTASKNRNRLSLLLETDQEFLVQSSAQWDPKIETMVHTSPNERPGEGEGSVESGSAKHSKNTSGGIHVMRTVDVSTSIVSLR